MTFSNKEFAALIHLTAVQGLISPLVPLRVSSIYDILHKKVTLTLLHLSSHTKPTTLSDPNTYTPIHTHTHTIYIFLQSYVEQVAGFIVRIYPQQKAT